MCRSIEWLEMMDWWIKGGKYELNHTENVLGTLPFRPISKSNKEPQRVRIVYILPSTAQILSEILNFLDTIHQN